MRSTLITVILGSLFGCTTSERFQRADGSTNFVVACGAAVGWNVCLDRAKNECPAGFDILAQGNDGNRKEMTIACGRHQVSPAARAAAACRLRVAEVVQFLPEAAQQARVKDCILAAGFLPEGD